MQPHQVSDDGDPAPAVPESTTVESLDASLPAEAQLETRYARCLLETAEMELDLSCLGLTTFPLEALVPGRFPKFRKLNLRKNHLSRLPDPLGSSFPHLTTLDVSDNLLEELPEQLGASLGRLQRLIAANNKLRLLPATLARLDQLQELNLRSNKLETIDEKLGALPRLQVVDLGANDALEDAPERLRRLHERNLLLHSRSKRRELISRALRVRAAVAHTLLATNATVGSPSPVGAASVGKSSVKRNTVI